MKYILNYENVFHIDSLRALKLRKNYLKPESKIKHENNNFFDLGSPNNARSTE